MSRFSLYIVPYGATKACFPLACRSVRPLIGLGRLLVAMLSSLGICKVVGGWEKKENRDLARLDPSITDQLRVDKS